ncbi:MFS transporter [Silicimonas sp. MF1-12-2]|uniref:MFS transporter n=1 Tax=Silicimonas sp. MF1-12-2 TaxID=3384793 RepID=UPI0039B5582D
MRVLDQPGRIAARRVIIWVGIMMAVSLLIMTFGALRAFDAAIQPELDKRSLLIGTSIRDSVENALEMGLPLGAVSGADKYLEDVLQEFDEVRSITLLTRSGEIVSQAESATTSETSVVSRVANVGARAGPSFSVPILNRNTLVGEVRIEIEPGYLRARLQNILLDIFVVGLVATLLAFELVVAVAASALGKPLDRMFTLLRMQARGDFSHFVPEADGGNLRRVLRRVSDRALDLAERGRTVFTPKRLPQAYFVDVRLPLFVFSLATEISGAFLPMYARDATNPPWLAPELAATLPLIAYLAAIAVISPFGGKILRVVTPRTLFLLCIPLTALAMVGVGLGQSALWIAIWHGAMALVYAAAAIACQEYAIRTAPKGEDAQAIASYLFVILGGAFCGTAIGGVLADRVGMNETFFVGAVLVLISGIIAAFFLSGNVAPREFPTTEEPRKTARPFAVLFKHRVLALIFGVAVPMNIGMSVFIWYLTPLILEAAGAQISDIGRVVMVYYLVPVLVGPTIARLADGKVGYVPMLVVGTIVAGCALSSLYFGAGFWPMVGAVGFFGLGFAMCDAVVFAHIIRIAEESGIVGARDTSLAALRIIVRLAAIAGLLVGAQLVLRFDYVWLAVAIGMLFFIGAFLMIVAEGSHAMFRRSKVGTP